MSNSISIDETHTASIPSFAISPMEANKHTKLITILSNEYVNMITKPPQPLRYRKKKGIVNKIRKLVSGQKVSDFQNLTTEKPSTTTSVKTLQVLDDKESKINNENGPGCLGNNICWWEPPEHSLPLDFCRDTSLHGLKYIGQSHRHLSERIFWLAAFLAGLILAVVLISDVWNKYNSSPIIVSFQSSETSIDQIPFPAVTICNMNKVLRNKAEHYIKLARAERGGESIDDVFYLDHVCSATKSFTKRFNYSFGRGDIDISLLKTDHANELTKVNEFLRKASQNCSDMIPLCLWQDAVYNCSNLFRPIETEFGKCCTFNMVPQSALYSLRNDERDDPKEVEQWKQWDLSTGDFLLTEFINEFPRRQMQAGKTFGLSFLLNPSMDEYFCTTSDSAGFRMATHLPIDVPHVTDFGISILPRAEVFVNIKPEMTMMDQSVFKFDQETRKCYYFGEYSLKYYSYYTLTNCIDECIANSTMEVCKCKRYYMPRDENQLLCGGNQTSFECAEAVKINMTKFGAKNGCKMCLASCSELEYVSQTTSTPLQDGIWQGSQNQFPGWVTENVSIVHVFVGVDSTYARVRKELFGSTDLFANTGGLMGLCLGFSGLSAMEVIYFLTLRAYWNYKRKKNIAQKISKKLKDIWAKAKAIKLLQKGSQVHAIIDKDKETPRNTLQLETTKSKNVTFSYDDKHADGYNQNQIEKDRYKELTKQSLDYKNILGDIKPGYPPHKY